MHCSLGLLAWSSLVLWYDISMAKRRTKKDKVSAQHEYTYRLTDLSGPSDQNRVKSGQVRREPAGESKVITAQELFGYDPRLIRTDMVKTLVVSGLILAIELALYWYW